MIQIIVNAFVEKDKTGAVVEVLFASADQNKVQAKYAELVAQYPENYLAIYDLPMDTDLSTLDHYPSVFIGKEEFE
ncbi:hypothetical protein SMIE22_00860 [Streptococcus mitis]|uniref:phosphoribosylaminoimidazole carboxylase n=1 Tax=Streptococcus mitis TaxID=28037 RepID=UPI00398C0671